MITDETELIIPDYDPYQPQTLSRRHQARLLQQSQGQEASKKA